MIKPKEGLIHSLVTRNVKDILLSCGLKENVKYKATGNEWSLDHIISLIESNYEILFSLKTQDHEKQRTNYNRGFYADFWTGYIHGIVDFDKYGKITEEEGMELEDLFETDE